MNSPNYRDFYPRKVIPIGYNDHILLSTDNPQPNTHWMIALEGELSPKHENEFYIWRVCVYSCDCEGSFDWKKPYYTSSAYECFHEACDSAQTLEIFGKQDALCSASILDKIG